jgi:iron complex outermembrane recepter protein
MHTSRIYFSVVAVALVLSTFAAETSAQAAPEKPNAAAPSSASSAAKIKTEQVDTIEVVGRRQAGAYHADEATGTKTDLPLREVPQAVRVMSRQTLDDLGAVRLDDVLDYAGGVSRQNQFGGLWDNVAIRGFAGDINNGMTLLLNGFSGNRGFNAPRDTASVERIEFLKGPVASLFGTTEPGGTINVVTKKPRWQAGHSLEGYAGSFDFWRTTLDSTGPLGESVAYRLNIALENRDSVRDFINTRRELVAPAFTWRIAAATTVDYFGEWLRHRTPLDRGVVAVNGVLGPVPRERFTGEPADGTVEVENFTHQLAIEHAFSDQWRGRLAIAHKEGSLYGFSTEPQPTLQADQATLRRQRRFRDYDSSDITVQAEAVGKFNVGGIRNELMIGAEHYRFDVDQLLLRVNPTAAAPYAINVFNPVYGQPQPVPAPNTDTSELQKNIALYVQNAASLGAHWRVLAGVRMDDYDQTLFNRRTGVATTQSPRKTTPRLGLSFLPSDEWTVFANLGRSFRPNTGADARGSAFAPESGRAIEVGGKWENRAKTIGGTIAYFDIRKRNVLTSDPANAGFSIAAGEVQSRGVDIDFSGQLTAQWRINASFSHIDVKVKRDNVLALNRELLNIPRNNASVLLVYEGALAAGSRFGVGGGATYSAKRLGEALTQAQVNAGTAPFELPDYTVAKLVAYWRMSNALRFSLDVDNLFDKTYYTNSFQRTWVAVGAARTVTVGAQWKF